MSKLHVKKGDTVRRGAPLAIADLNIIKEHGYNTDIIVVITNTDKLKSMIASDPDTVAEFFTQLAKNLYSSLTTKMQSTTLSSAYTIYNDKSLKEDLSDIEDTIEKWEDKVADYEETWYKKFSDMETALSKLQSSTSSLTSLLGS